MANLSRTKVSNGLVSFHKAVKFLYFILRLQFFLFVSYVYRKTILPVLIACSGIERNEFQNVDNVAPGFFSRNGVPDCMVVAVLKLRGIPNLSKVKALFQKAVEFETAERWDPDCESKTDFPKYKPFHRLRYKLVKKFCVRFWVECKNFDINNHVSEIIAPNAQDLNQVTNHYCESRSTKTSDNNHPSWEVVLVRSANASEEKHYCLIISINHIYTDGISMIQFIRYGLADQPPPTKINPMDPTRPSFEQVLQEATWKQIAKAAFNCFTGLVHGYVTSCDLSTDSSLPPHRRQQHQTFGGPIAIEGVRKLRKQYSNSSTTAIFSLSLTRAMELVFQNMEAPKSLPVTNIFAGFPYPTLEFTNRFVPAVTYLDLGGRSDSSLTQSYERQLARTSSPLILAILNKALQNGALLLNQWMYAVDFTTASILITNIIGPDSKFNMFNGDEVIDMRMTLSRLMPFNNAIITLVSFEGELKVTSVAQESKYESPLGITKIGGAFSEMFSTLGYS